MHRLNSRPIGMLLLGVTTVCWSFACGEIVNPPAQVDAGDADADVEPGLAPIARYSLDEVSGGLFRDDTGNGHDAACVGQCPPVGRGIFETAVSFGDGPFLQVADDGALVHVDGFTVSVWVSPGDVNAGRRTAVIGKQLGDGLANSWQIVIDEVGRPEFFSAVSDEEQDFVSADQPLVQDEFAHVAITWDGATKRLYSGGQLVGARVADIVFTTDPVSIGADIDNGNIVARFEGLVDEVQLFDRALTDAEVAELATPPSN